MGFGQLILLTLLFPEGNNGFSFTGKVSLSHSVKSRINHGPQKITERGTRSMRQLHHQFKTPEGHFGRYEFEDVMAPPQRQRTAFKPLDTLLVGST